MLLDRSAAENTIEIVVAFATVEDAIAAVKSDLIKDGILWVRRRIRYTDDCAAQTRAVRHYARPIIR